MKFFPLYSLLSFAGMNGHEACKTYDLLIIGAGSTGLTAAKFASTFGKSVAIIEKSRMGGDCTWTGCVPSKTLIASAKAANAVRKAGSLGIEVNTPININMKAIKRRIELNIQHIYDADDSPEALKKLGIDVIEGTAKFLSKKEIVVTSSDTPSSDDETET